MPGGVVRLDFRHSALYDRPVDREEYRRTALENWQTIAAGWERRRAQIEETTRPVTDWMVRALDPQPGETVLELAAGPGDVGFAAAALIGDTGRLISSDFSSEMVDVARRRASELGLRNVEHRQIDAEDIPVEDGSVDGVLCRFGLMLMPDPEAVVAETRRVLGPNGRLALAVWSTGQRNPWVTIAGRILVERGHAPPPDPEAPGPFALADHERLRELLEDGGFTVVNVEEVPIAMKYDDVDAFIAVSTETSGMLARIWAEVSAAERGAIAARLAEDFAPFAVDGGYELPGVAVVASAT
jgi:SAM-dependent methyltransferase